MGCISEQVAQAEDARIAARLIHDASHRARNEFVPISAAGMTSRKLFSRFGASVWNASVFVLVAALQVLRACLEERFLAPFPIFLTAISYIAFMKLDTL